MKEEDFVSDYISNCVETGICSPASIVEKAQQRVDEIDELLMAQNFLRQEKINLEKVIRTFSKKTNRAAKPAINTDAEESELTEEYRDLILSVCSIVEPSQGIMPREIINKMMNHNSIKEYSHDERQKVIYLTIKWLIDRDIIGKNSDRSLRKGDCWENKPG